MDGTQDSDLYRSYSDPVRQMLFMGEPDGYIAAKWPDYAKEFGIRDADVDALIRMVCDPALHEADTRLQAVWAPVHAWRALGQLRAEAAIAPLVALLPTLDGDDAAEFELPRVFALIGPASIPPLVGYLSDRERTGTCDTTAVLALAQIADQHPDCRDRCVDVLVRMLASDALSGTDRGIVVSTLLDLRAVEAIEPMRDAFRRGTVDISIAGDIEDVEIELGLRDSRVTPKPHYIGRRKFDTIADVDVDEVPDWAMPDRPMPLRSEKIGRNESCPCGSGKKYKKCCMP